jgi:hypothetical protein
MKQDLLGAEVAEKKAPAFTAGAETRGVYILSCFEKI